MDAAEVVDVDSTLVILYSRGSVNANKFSRVGSSAMLAMCFVHSSRILGLKSSNASAMRYCDRVAAFMSFIA